MLGGSYSAGKKRGERSTINHNIFPAPKWSIAEPIAKGRNAVKATAL